MFDKNLDKVRILFRSATGAAWCNTIVQIFSVLFVLPLILKNFSPVEVSFWLLISTIMGFASLSNLGFSYTAVRLVSFYAAGMKELPNEIQDSQTMPVQGEETNFEGLLHLQGTLRVIYHFLTITVLVVVSIAGTGFCWHILALSGHSRNLWMAYVSICVTCVISVNTARWSAIVQGLNKIATLNRFAFATGTLKILSFFVLLLLHKAIFALTLVILLEAFSQYIFSRHCVLAFFKKHKVSLKNAKFDKETFKYIWKPSWRMGGIQWGGYLINQGNAIVVAQLSDPKAIATFLFSKKMLDFVLAFAQVPFNVNIQNVYRKLMSQSQEQAREYISRLFCMGITLFVLAAVFLAFFGNNTLRLFHIPAYLLGAKLFLLMTLTSLLEMHHSWHAAIYMSTNRVPFLLPALVSGGAILMLGFLTVGKWGVVGLIVIQFAVQASFNNWFPVKCSLNFLRWKVVDYLLQFPVIGFRSIWRLL